MQEIANTECYKLVIDDRKRRVYHSVFGTWSDAPEVSRFLEDWEMVLTKISDGYTMLTDARQFRLFSTSWAATNIKIRKQLFQAGIKKIAELLPERTITQMQFNTISANVKDVVTRVFADQREAEAWLDSDC